MPSHTVHSTDEVYSMMRKSLKPLHKAVNVGLSNSNPYLRPEAADTEGEFVDLFLIHAPWGGEAGRAANWKALVRAKEEGWARDIGVSNLCVSSPLRLPLSDRLS
jgi:hypothetical protein